MRWKFWQTEKRSSYTDLVVERLVTAAQTQVRNASKTAALESASGLYASAFSVATHNGPGYLTPSLLAEAARRQIRWGEALFLIDVVNGEIVLLPASSWTVSGGYQESDWLYQVSISGPSDTLEKTVTSDSVLHFRYSVNPSEPWRGLSPLANASETGSLAGKIESKLSEETSTPSATVIPSPLDGGDGGDTDPLKLLKADLKGAKGGAVFARTMASGYGAGMAGAPQRDWGTVKIGPAIDEVLADLRAAVFADCLRCCQVPSALFDDSDGTAQREAYRRFVMASCEGLASRMQEEILKKLEVAVELSFQSMWGHDIKGRSDSFRALTSGGLEASEARRIAGI